MPKNASGDPQWWEEIDPQAQRAMELERHLMQLKLEMQEKQLMELEEKHRRETNPAAKDAYEKYQTIMKLTKDGS